MFFGWILTVPIHFGKIIANCGLRSSVAAAAVIVSIVHFTSWEFKDCLYQTVFATMSDSDDKVGGIYGRLLFSPLIFRDFTLVN